MEEDNVGRLVVFTIIEFCVLVATMPAVVPAGVVSGPVVLELKPVLLVVIEPCEAVVESTVTIVDVLAVDTAAVVKGPCVVVLDPAIVVVDAGTLVDIVVLEVELVAIAIVPSIVVVDSSVTTPDSVLVIDSGRETVDSLVLVDDPISGSEDPEGVGDVTLDVKGDSVVLVGNQQGYQVHQFKFGLKVSFPGHFFTTTKLE